MIRRKAECLSVDMLTKRSCGTYHNEGPWNRDILHSCASNCCQQGLRQSQSQGVKRTKVVDKISNYSAHNDSSDQLRRSQAMEKESRIGRRHAASDIGLQDHRVRRSLQVQRSDEDGVMRRDEIGGAGARMFQKFSLTLSADSHVIRNLFTDLSCLG